MKTTNMIKLIIFTVIALLNTISCVDDDIFTIPAIGQQENAALEKIKDSLETSAHWTLISISDLKNQFTSGSNAFQITSHQVVKGYVVSSDKTGNFFKEFYLQDHPTNPTAALKIVLNLTNAHNRFNLGREVYVHLKDLYVGETVSGDGVTAIGGKLDDNEVDALTENQIETHLFRSERTEVITPLLITFTEINEQHIGIFVTIENVHFSSEFNGKPYVDQIDDFDTQRLMTSCDSFDYSHFILETSTFALFKNEILPSGSGTISGIVSKTYNGDNFILAINNTSDVVMNGALCTLLDIEAYTTVLLEENFETTTGNIVIDGWTNYKEEGTKLWRSYIDEDTGSRAAKIGSYSSGNERTISWLISKSVNLDAVNDAFLSFETSNSFADGSNLEALITADWDGDTTTINNANWAVLPAAIVKDADDFDEWIHSGYINISTYTGTVYIAFKYTGSGHEDFDGTFELDAIKMIAK